MYLISWSSDPTLFPLSSMLLPPHHPPFQSQEITSVNFLFRCIYFPTPSLCLTCSQLLFHSLSPVTNQCVSVRLLLQNPE